MLWFVISVLTLYHTLIIMYIQDAIGDPSTDTSQEPSDSPSIDNLNLDKPSDSNTRVIPVHFGVKFVAGKIEFSFTALPNELLYTLRMFAAARRGDLEELTNIIEASKSTEFVVHYVTVSPADNTNTNWFSTISVSSNQGMYSETCVNGHLYSETTCIKRPLCDVPKVSAQYILTCIQRPPLYKGHYEVALPLPFNTGFTVQAR